MGRLATRFARPTSDATRARSSSAFRMASTIEGDGSSLGFPFNYQALPDISEDGDSGGPIMLSGTHTVVAIVDTDTVEQNIAETTPIDLFARIDLVKDAIEQQMAHPPASDGGANAPGVTSASGGGCSVAAPGR